MVTDGTAAHETILTRDETVWLAECSCGAAGCAHAVALADILLGAAAEPVGTTGLPPSWDGVFRESRGRAWLTAPQIVRLGLDPGPETWRHHHLWPAAPRSEAEFALGVVAWARDMGQEAGVSPEALAQAAAGDPPPAFAGWHRSMRTSRWIGWIGAMAADAGALSALRLRLEGPESGDYRLISEGGTAIAPPPLPPLPESGWIVPADVIESVDGVAFLERCGVAVPDFIAGRLIRVGFRVSVKAELTSFALGDKNEWCVLSMEAESADGWLINRYDEHGWLARDATRAAVEPTAEQKRWRLTDRSALAAAEIHFRRLEARHHPATRRWQVRVADDFAERFARWMKTAPACIALDLSPELASLRLPPVSLISRLEIAEDGLDWFEVRALKDVSDTDLSALELKALMDAEGHYVRLGKKGWRRAEDGTPPEAQSSLSSAGLTPHGMATTSRRYHTLQLAQEPVLELLPEEIVRRVQARAAALLDQPTPAVPSSIKADLRPYQREGFEFLARLSQLNCGAILADDMGLGKTLQTLVWMAWVREQAAAKHGAEAIPPCLVVCPKSLTDNWRAEARKFLPSLHVRVWKSRDLRLFAQEARWAGLNVLNYPQLRTVADKLGRVEFLTAVLDEAQAIKNPDSATSRAARAIQATHRLALSGTPIENSLLDLWSVMAFAMPGALGNRATFERFFEGADDSIGRRELAQRVRPFLLRRTKLQVAKDLPERIEEDLYCEMEAEQSTLYRAELKKAQQQLLRVESDRQWQEQRFHVLASLMRLRQICCDPTLVFPAVKASSAKLDALDDLLEPIVAEGQKVLLFSQFTGMLDRLKDRLTRWKVPIFLLTGATENRGAMVEAFQKTKGPAIFLISLKAGGAGLTLTAASYVVLFDPWWNPAVEAQAIDRSHRIGQTRTVIAYRLLIKDSLEEKIRALQSAKAALANEVLGEETFASSLSLSELRKVLLA